MAVWRAGFRVLAICCGGLIWALNIFLMTRHQMNEIKTSPTCLAAILLSATKFEFLLWDTILYET